MSPRIVSMIVTVTALAGAAPVFCAEASSMGGDLKATIVLQGQACDQVVDSKRNGDSDYVATCKDGNRYHVYVNTQGRVVVEKL